MEEIWELDTCSIADTNRTTANQVQDGDGECNDTGGKDQEEHPDLAHDANNDGNKAAHTMVDSELIQLTSTSARLDNVSAYPNKKSQGPQGSVSQTYNV